MTVKSKIFLLLLLSQISFSHAKLLDKIIAVVDTEIYTLSDVQAVLKNYPARQEIAALVYPETENNIEGVINHFIHRDLIRSKLAEMNIILSDDSVNQLIQENAKRMNTNKEALYSYLATKGLSSQEYFELAKELREFMIFINLHVRVNVSISEYQIKNEFLKQNQDNKTLAFKYQLVDFSISSSKIKDKAHLELFLEAVKDLESGKTLPSEFESLATNNLGEISEDGLDKNLKDLLKKTDEKSFSSPYLLDKNYHVFFVEKKELVESEFYLQEKNAIHEKLYKEQMDELIKNWFIKEKKKHHVVISL